MPNGGKRPGAGRRKREEEDTACELLLDKLANGATINEQEHKQLQRYEIRKRKRAHDARRKEADNENVHGGGESRTETNG